jgi:two-component system sensor histidine kinase/response regulator
VPAVERALEDGDRELEHFQCLTKPPKQSELIDALLAATAPVADGSADGNAQGDAGHQALRVLLAEDGAINREVALGLLEIEGHDVSIAENGREALRMLETERFDVILMDLEMPEMDGLQAARAIRELEAGTGERTPIIAMTAHAVAGYRDKCLAAGMDGYLTKPIWPDALFAAINNVRKRRARNVDEQEPDGWLVDASV